MTKVCSETGNPPGSATDRHPVPAAYVRVLYARLKPVAILLSSNAIATVVVAVGTLAVTQVVTPAEFGKYALCVHVAVSIYPAMTLRYEHALPLLGRSDLVILLLAICLGLLAATTLTLWIVGGLFFSVPVLAGLLPAEVRENAVGIVVTAFALGLASVFQSFSLARNLLTRLAIARVLRAVCLISLQIGLVASLGASALWLIVAEAAANVIYASLLASAVGLSGIWYALGQVKGNGYRRIPVLLARYKEFPLITLPHMLSHTGLALLFASSLGFMYGAAALGQYYLMRKVVFGILGLFSVAIYQHSVAEAARVEKANLFRVGWQALFLTAPFTISVAVVSLLYGPDFFRLTIGDAWSDAGRIAAASFLLIMVEPIASAQAFLPTFLGKQRVAFLVAVLQGLVAIGGLSAAFACGFQLPEALLVASSAVSTVMVAYVAWLLAVCHPNFRHR